MRPEQQTTILENPRMSFSSLKQTTILNILNVIIMMWMTYARFKQFYENVDMSMIRGICRHGGRKKRCHGGETEMVPRQHPGSGSSWRYWCKRKCADVRNMLEMVGCSRLPGSLGLVAWKRVTNRTRCKRCISYNTHALVHGRSSCHYTFEACIFEADWVRRGVGEVRVLGTGVVEVVVHVLERNLTDTTPSGRR